MIMKPATELHEFLQIHRLNYKTFVEEIPQHRRNSEKKLVDKFHDKNKYIIAKKRDRCNRYGMLQSRSTFFPRSQNPGS